MTKNKIKTFAITAIAMLVISLSTTVNAETLEFFKGELPIEAHHLMPFANNFTCIEHNGALKPTLSKETLGNYEEGSTASDSWCSGCYTDPDKPWTGALTTAYYTVGNSIDYRQYQDAAYIIAESNEKGELLSINLRDALWSTNINKGTIIPANRLGQEAATYKEFYERIHAGTKDIFMSLVQDKTNVGEVKVGVNQSEKSYTVGPFRIQYPEGKFGDKKFSYINKIEAVTNDGTLQVEVLNANGGRCEDTDKNGNKLNVPKSNEEFYIKFYSTTATTVSLKTTFSYLEHCEATMNEVNGQYQNWEWKKTSTGDSHTHYKSVEDQDTYYGPHPGCDNSGTHTHGNGTYHQEIDAVYSKYKYVLNKTLSGRIQELLKYQGGSKIWSEGQYIIGSGIDLTMNIAGYVFLDQDQGKVNEGNSLLDGGEALSGVEVYLYDSEGNQVSAGGNYTHVHSGDRVHGGECFSEPVYHVHDESCYVYSHIHKGNAINGGKGTCYNKPVYHEHDYTCYNSDSQLICPYKDSADGTQIEYYELSCNEKVTKTLICGKKERKVAANGSILQEGTIDYYKLTCRQTQGDSYSHSSVRLTDSNGHYEFTKLNAMKKYYVKFIYNGMLYTNVDYNVNGAQNASKSTENRTKT